MERESKEARPFFVRATDETGALVDITTAGVEVAFARDRFRPTTWVAATWVAGGPFDGTPIGIAYEADIVISGVGHGGAIELEPGRWDAFVRVSTGSEVAVMHAGSLNVL